jgi:hypothetical protein
MAHAHATSRRRGTGLGLVVAVAALIGATLSLGHAAADAATTTSAAVAGATLRDPANDVKAGDIDLTSIAVSKRDGALVVRFTVRRPITNNVSYTASVKAGGGSWALVARRGGGTDSFLLYNLTTGTTTPIAGAIKGRTATVSAPIDALGGQTNGTLGRVSAYFRAEPVGGRSGDADRAATTGPTVWFCLTDRQPRPKWGPCIWPGQIR